ncbi:hypothetical protein IFM89_014485, partial [Coptis chinensis]
YNYSYASNSLGFEYAGGKLLLELNRFCNLGGYFAVVSTRHVCYQGRSLVLRAVSKLMTISILLPYLRENINKKKERVAAATATLFVLKLHLGGPNFVENVNISRNRKVAYPSDVADSQVDSEINLNASEMDGNCKGSHSDFSGPTSRSTTCIAIVPKQPLLLSQMLVTIIV